MRSDMNKKTYEYEKVVPTDFGAFMIWIYEKKEREKREFFENNPHANSRATLDMKIDDLPELFIEFLEENN